jgi:hypothetical protein
MGAFVLDKLPVINNLLDKLEEEHPEPPNKISVFFLAHRFQPALIGLPLTSINKT